MSALINGLRIFDLFLETDETVTVVEIGRKLDIHKSTASRIAATLVAEGYLRPSTRASGFELGGKFKRLGEIAAGSADLAELAGPLLRSLAADLGETCHLGVLDGDESVTVGFADGPHAMRMHAFVGKRSPAHCTAMGKSILAHLDESAIDQIYPNDQLRQTTSHSVQTKTQLRGELTKVREAGFAIDDEELEIGLRCVSAPVRDHTGQVCASVTLACSAARVSLEDANIYATRVIGTANAISGLLGANQLEEPAA